MHEPGTGVIAIPTLDIQDGACVQLKGGARGEEVVRLADPAAVAAHWATLGFSRLHVADLDAALGRRPNEAVVQEILATRDVSVQVGGGVRDEDDVERLFDAGAAWVVIGTRALEDPTWLSDVVSSWPGRIVVAADVRQRQVVTRGWERMLRRTIDDVIPELNTFALAAVMVTAVHREGELEGADLPLMEDVAEESAHPVIARGGIATLNDLRALADRGVSAAVVGMALYTGVLDPRHLSDEFGAESLA